jgi:hypothetical protein
MAEKDICTGTKSIEIENGSMGGGGYFDCRNTIKLHKNNQLSPKEKKSNLQATHIFIFVILHL